MYENKKIIRIAYLRSDSIYDLIDIVNKSLKETKNWQPFGSVSGPDSIGYYTQTMVLYEENKEDLDVL